MELVSNATPSFLDGLFQESFRTFLVLVPFILPCFICCYIDCFGTEDKVNKIVVSKWKTPEVTCNQHVTAAREFERQDSYKYSRN